jgi:hypothetical protein
MTAVTQEQAIARLKEIMPDVMPGDLLYIEEKDLSGLTQTEQDTGRLRRIERQAMHQNGAVIGIMSLFPNITVEQLD